MDRINFRDELLFSLKANALTVLATLALVTSLTFIIILISYESERKELKLKLKKSQNQIKDMELRVLSIHALNFITPRDTPHTSPRSSISMKHTQRNNLSPKFSNINNQSTSANQNHSTHNLKFKEALNDSIDSPGSLAGVLPSNLSLSTSPTQESSSINSTLQRLPIFETIRNKKNIPDKEIRIWMDGAFDMMHYGHMNAFRQGRSLGTKLIVGVNSDETITACKGKPVFNDIERIQTVKACKWVDEVVEGVPYIMNEEYLNYVIEKYKIDYVVHGDDPCIVDGKDVYETAKKLGKYYIFK